MKTYILILTATFISSLIFSQKIKDSTQLKIIGGNTVNIGDYPWMASLVTDVGIQGCGASLIAPQWVLTAGHCFVDNPNAPQNIKVILNSLTTNENALEPFSELIDIDTFFIHHNFTLDLNLGSINGPDIALIRLTDPSTVPPVQLADFSDSALFNHHLDAKILGWGITNSGGMHSDSLLLANSFFIGNNQCENFYASAQQGNPYSSNPNGVICAGYYAGVTPVGSASGDSGGPLFFEENGIDKIVGIVSGGNSDITLEDYPGVFTKVPVYRNWIDSIMNTYEDFSNISDNKNSYTPHFYRKNQSVKIDYLNVNDTYLIEVYSTSGKLIERVEIKGATSAGVNTFLYQDGLYIFNIFNLRTLEKVQQKIFIN